MESNGFSDGCPRSDTFFQFIEFLLQPSISFHDPQLISPTRRTAMIEAPTPFSPASSPPSREQTSVRRR